MKSKSLTKTEDTNVTEVERASRVHTFTPDIDVYETEEGFCILAEMPGIVEDSLDVMFERGELVISGKRQQNSHTGRRYLLREYEAGDYHRVLRVGEAVNHEKIQAEYEAGLLKVHLPKTEAARPRRIKIKTR
jgi:HSP20 family molecular chaperone IbpA